MFEEKTKSINAEDLNSCFSLSYYYCTNWDVEIFSNKLENTILDEIIDEMFLLSNQTAFLFSSVNGTYGTKKNSWHDI